MTNAAVPAPSIRVDKSISFKLSVNLIYTNNKKWVPLYYHEWFTSIYLLD